MSNYKTSHVRISFRNFCKKLYRDGVKFFAVNNRPATFVENTLTFFSISDYNDLDELHQMFYKFQIFQMERRTKRSFFTDIPKVPNASFSQKYWTSQQPSVYKMRPRDGRGCNRKWESKKKGSRMEDRIISNMNSNH